MSEQVKHTLHWVQGNTVNFAIPLQQETQTPQGKVVEDYYPAVDDVVTVSMCGKYLSTQIPCTVDGNVVIANDNGTLKVDVYGVEIRIKKADGTNLRSMWDTQVQIHKTNDGVLTEWDDFVAPDSQSLDAAIFFFAKGDKGDKGDQGIQGEKGEQGDKGEKGDKGDAGTTDYNELENKPDLSIYQEKEQGKGLSENDYTDEEKQLVHSAVQQESDPTVPQWAKQPNKPTYTAQEVNALPANTHIPSTTAELTNDAGFITNTVNNLVNYYLKSETYTKAEVQTLVNAVKQFTYEVVQTLPMASADTMNKIYLTPSSDPQTQNVKDEFITIDNGQEAQTRYTWEQIGSTAIDLSGYYTSAQTDAAITAALNAALANYTTTAALTLLLAGKQDTLTAGTGIAIENNVIRATTPDMRELLVLTLAPTPAVEGTDPLLGATFTVTSAGATIASGTWGGTAVQVRIDTTQQYTVSFGSASGYLRPEPMTFTPILLNTRVVTASYTRDPSDELVIDESVENPVTRIVSGVNGQNVQAIVAGTHRYLGKLVDDGNGGDKMLLCQLSDTDSTKFFDGTTEAPLDGSQGDVWVKHPDTWIKAERDGDNVTLKIKITDNGGRKFPTECLIGAYEASSTTEKYGTTTETANDGTVGYLRSISGVASLGKVSKTNFSLKAARKGPGFSLVKPHHQNLFAVLGYARYGTCNMQAQCGSGTGSYEKPTGQTDSLGMTDTTSQNGNSMSINFFGLENWWGNKYEWMDANIINGGVWTITEDDGTTRTITAPSNGAWVFAMRFIWGDYIDVVPEATQTGGSDSKGYCDGYYGTTAGSRVALRSYSYSDSGGGVACVFAYADASYAGAFFGSRLAFNGVCRITTDVTAYLAAQPKA